MAQRSGNRPIRRIARADSLGSAERNELATRMVYVGSAHHKRSPGDYGFHPPVSPRPWKSLCDATRVILRAEARALLREGVTRGMVSELAGDGLPKYVWSVDADGTAYEAKLGTDGYHGYRLEDEDDMRSLVLKEWKKRGEPADD